MAESCFSPTRALSGERLAEVAQTLRRRGVPVSDPLRAPMGVVMKGLDRT